MYEMEYPYKNINSACEIFVSQMQLKHFYIRNNTFMCEMACETFIRARTANTHKHTQKRKSIEQTRVLMVYLGNS